MRHASSSLRGYQNAGSTKHEPRQPPYPGDPGSPFAGWGPALFFAAMVVIMIVSALLVTAISSR
jgi:hypothetical protein